MINIDQAHTSALLLAGSFRDHLISSSVTSFITHSTLFNLNEVEWRKNVLRLYKASIPLFVDFLTTPQYDFTLETKTQATMDALLNIFQLDPYVLDSLKKSVTWQQWSTPLVQQKTKTKEKMENEYQNYVKNFKEDYEVIGGNFNFDDILQHILDFEDDSYDFGALHSEISEELYDLQEMKQNLQRIERDINSQNISPMLKKLNDEEKASFIENLFIDHLKTSVFKESQDILECLSQNPSLTVTETPELGLMTTTSKTRKLG